MKARPSPAQRRVLENLAAGRASDFHCRTRSDHGGLVGTILSLRKRGWIDHQGEITEAGRALVLAPQSKV